MSSLPTTSPRGAPPARAPRDRWPLFLGCCFLVIAGLRAFLVETFGASIAWGDDIDAIAVHTLLPWEQGAWTREHLFAAHNGDHRIVFTRLWELLWFLLNGHTWDPKLVMIAKAPLYAAAATILIHLCVRGLERRRWLAGGLLALLFAFPFAQQNLLWAFQSQFDFFLLATALGWWALLAGRAVLALGIAALALFTIASGPIIAASFVPCFVVAWRTGKWSERRCAALTAAAGLIVAVGLALRTERAPPHHGSAVARVETFTRLAAWPHSNLLSAVERLPETARMIPAPLLQFPRPETSWLQRVGATLQARPGLVIALYGAIGLVVLAPTLVLAHGVWRRRIPRAVALGPLNLAVFAGLMLVATAIARAEQITIASRYLDFVLLPGALSLAACFILARRGRGARWLVAWGVVMLAGYVPTIATTLLQMKARKPDTALAVLREFYATNDPRVLTEGDRFRIFITGDDPNNFLAMLNRPGLRRVLPLAVVSPETPPPLASRLGRLAGRLAPGVALLGLAGMTWLAWRAQRTRRPVPAPAVGAPAKA